jgi:hypothetical protein
MMFIILKFLKNIKKNGIIPFFSLIQKDNNDKRNKYFISCTRRSFFKTIGDHMTNEEEEKKLKEFTKGYKDGFKAGYQEGFSEGLKVAAMRFMGVPMQYPEETMRRP